MFLTRKESKKKCTYSAPHNIKILYSITYNYNRASDYKFLCLHILQLFNNLPLLRDISMEVWAWKLNLARACPSVGFLLMVFTFS